MDRVDEILAKIATIETKLDNLERRLFGNGEEGIVERLRKVENQLTENKAVNKYKYLLIQMGFWFASMVFGAGLVWRFVK